MAGNGRVAAKWPDGRVQIWPVRDLPRFKRHAAKNKAAFGILPVDFSGNHEATIFLELMIAAVPIRSLLTVNPQARCLCQVVVTQFVGVRMCDVTDARKFDFLVPLKFRG